MTRPERWMSCVLPPRAFWVSALAIIAMAYGVSCFCAFIERHFQVTIGKNDPFSVYRATLGFTLAAYGVWRAGFYPAFESDYSAWLATIPWTSDRPLPGGPVPIVPQDAIVVGVLATASLLAGFAQGWPWISYMPLSFVVPYLLLLTIGNLTVRQNRAAAISLFAMTSMPLAIGRANAAWTLWLLVACAYVAAVWGVRHGLSGFPWNATRRTNPLETWVQQNQSRPPLAPPLISWRDVDLFSPLPWTTIAFVAGLGGWTTFTVADLADRLRDGVSRNRNELSLQEATLFIAACLAIMRAGVYCSRHHPPISFLGRIFTGRLFIPNYDKVLVGPILTVVAAWLTPRILTLATSSESAVLGGTVATTLAAWLGVGPSLRDWHLTGEHRLWLTKARLRRDVRARK